MVSFKHRFIAPASLESVREFHRRSRSMADITPPLIFVKIHSGPEKLSEGDEMNFTYWQEQTAKAMWNMALKLPPWPARSLIQGVKLIQTGASWLREDIRHFNLRLWVDAFRPLAVHLRELPDDLRLFVDGQLLISAQATSATANALYGASALDLPRRGAVHVKGGMGEIAKALARRVFLNGGRVLYRQEVGEIILRGGNQTALKTSRGDEFPADVIIANLPPWNVLALLKGNKPSVLKKLPERPYKGWGAFMVYVGLEDAIIPRNFPLHHQVIVREPLGEGNSVFLSLSPEWDDTRAPLGKRALTISTHTRYEMWWKLHERDRNQYENQKREYTSRLLSAAEKVLPGLCHYIHLALPGTPLSFQRFTRRAWGWVGGFPQINLFQSLPSRLYPNLWMVGDSFFPGQSVTATALGGLRVAGEVLEENCI